MTFRPASRIATCDDAKHLSRARIALIVARDAIAALERYCDNNIARLEIDELVGTLEDRVYSLEHCAERCGDDEAERSQNANLDRIYARHDAMRYAAE